MPAVAGMRSKDAVEGYEPQRETSPSSARTKDARKGWGALAKGPRATETGIKAEILGRASAAKCPGQRCRRRP